MDQMNESEQNEHDEPGVCLGDDQTEAKGLPSQDGRVDALLRHMPPQLTWPDHTWRTLSDLMNERYQVQMMHYINIFDDRDW